MRPRPTTKIQSSRICMAKYMVIPKYQATSPRSPPQEKVNRQPGSGSPGDDKPRHLLADSCTQVPSQLISNDPHAKSLEAPLRTRPGCCPRQTWRAISGMVD